MEQHDGWIAGRMKGWTDDQRNGQMYTTHLVDDARDDPLVLLRHVEVAGASHRVRLAGAGLRAMVGLGDTHIQKELDVTHACVHRSPSPSFF